MTKHEPTKPPATREPQYQRCLDVRDRCGIASFGLMSNQTWHDDPRRLTFVLARYKFIARMFTGKSSVLEIGCADAFGTRLVQQAAGRVTAIDFDPLFIEDVRSRMDPDWPLDCRAHDILDGPVTGEGSPFDAAYSLDVLEHIDAAKEERFLTNITASLTPHAAAIIGTPSIHSQTYASPASLAGHVNCKDETGLRDLMGRHFHQVFIFSMNDEVVHTGFTPMAHYLLALGCDPKHSAKPSAGP